MKRMHVIAGITAAIVLLVFVGLHRTVLYRSSYQHLTVGFIYDGDESIPYTYNFSLAANALKEKFGDKILVLTKSNVLENEIEDPVREMVQKGCQIIFTNSYSSKFPDLAKAFPDVEFCQVSYLAVPNEDTPPNYHTFKGEAYQARYVTGIAAGLKLQEMISRYIILPKDAVIGFIAAYPTAEIISGYTAFLLGVRSVVPEATMKVRYTHTWSSYALEKQYAEELLSDGCIVISQHTDTIGPAIACEKAAARKQVIFVGYNKSMIDIAPASALISSRVNWSPYVTGAVQALLDGQQIEKAVQGSLHGSHDMSAGFDRNWVQVLDLNTYIAAKDTQLRVDEAIASLTKGNLQVFKGNYIGVNPSNASDTIDLKQGYIENKNSSSPSFNYILKDIIEQVA